MDYQSSQYFLRPVCGGQDVVSHKLIKIGLFLVRRSGQTCSLLKTGEGEQLNLPRKYQTKSQISSSKMRAFVSHPDSNLSGENL